MTKERGFTAACKGGTNDPRLGRATWGLGPCWYLKKLQYILGDETYRLDVYRAQKKNIFFSFANC